VEISGGGAKGDGEEGVEYDQRNSYVYMKTE
jgi:hypothetical protein